MKDFLRKSSSMGLIGISLVLTSCNVIPFGEDRGTGEVEPIPPVGERSSTEAEEQPWTADVSRQPQGLSETLGFHLSNGEDIFTYQQEDNRVWVRDGQGEVNAVLVLESPQKMRVEDAGETVIGYVMTRSDSWRVRKPDQTEELFVLTRRDDGNYRMRKGDGERIYRINARSYGYEVQSPDEVSLYRVRQAGDRLALHNSQAVDEPLMLYTEGEFLAPGMFVFGLEALSFVEQAALAYAVNQAGG